MCEEGSPNLKSRFSTMPWRSWLWSGRTEWHPLLHSLLWGLGKASGRAQQPLVLSEQCNGKHSLASLHNPLPWAPTSLLRCYFVRQKQASVVLFRRIIRFPHWRALSPRCMPIHLTGRDTLLHSPEWMGWLIAYLFKLLLQSTLELKCCHRISSFSQRRCEIDASN